MQKLVVLAGLPGSGKSTLGRILKERCGMFGISSDNLRMALNAGIYPRGVAKADYQLLNPVVSDLMAHAERELLLLGCSVFIDATNLSRSRRQHWISIAKSIKPGIHTSIFWFNSDFDNAERWQSRGYSSEEWLEIREMLLRDVERPSHGEAHHLRIIDGQFPVDRIPDCLWRNEPHDGTGTVDANIDGLN